MHWGAHPFSLPRSFWRSRDPKAHNRDRIAAAREILDRGWGKAVGLADMDGANPLEMDDVAAEIRSIAATLEQQRLSHSH